MVNWFVNAEGDHLYMEPGHKPVEHSHPDHGHPHTHAHGHDAPHVHVHPPSIENGGKGAGFFGSITQSFNSLREKGLSFGKKRGQARMQPLSTVDTDMEMEDANTKTQRQYAKLAKRRSML